MTARMSISIATPSELLVESGDVRSVRATDASGSFGVLPGHADLLTVLPASVVEWREGDGARRYCAVRAGVFSVSEGKKIAIACRQAVLGRALDELEQEVHLAGAAQTEADRRARVEQMRLHARVVRQLLQYLQPSAGRGAFPGSPADDLR